MTSLSTCFALLVTFMIATKSVQADTSSPSSWAKLQISPDTLVSMEHGSFRVDIYEHADNHKENTLPNRHKYFYAPIALLDNKGATSSFNNVTQKAEMRFRIEMWNQEVQNKVVKYLGQVLGRKVNSHQVQIIPLENVILASTSSSTIYTLSTDWKPCRQHKSLWFALSCFDIKDCNQLAANMRSNPEQFDHFKLLFSLSSQTSKTKETTIRIENIVAGQMVSDLLQRFGHEKDVFLTANDEKRLVMETATNIFVETFDDSDVVSQNSESQVYNVLKNLLVSSRTTIKEQSDKMWESVFWNEDNYRPDKTTKTLNKMYNKLDTDNQKKLADSYQNANKVGGKVEVKILEIFSASGEFNKDLADQGIMTKEDLDKIHQESRDHVVWDGKKFIPKPLALSRINLSRLKDTQSLKNRKVSVRYTTAVLSTPINFVRNDKLTTTDEWQILKEQVKETTERLEETAKHLARINITVLHAIANLTILTKLTETAERLEESVKHLAQTNTTVFHAIGNMTALTTNTTTSTTIRRMPMSCADLRLMGHSNNGFYFVMGNKRLESVYCDFTTKTQGDFQKRMGVIDVKSHPVHYVKTVIAKEVRVGKDKDVGLAFEFRTGSTRAPIVNEGNALLNDGVFRAPTPGKYFISFSGQCDLINHVSLLLAIDGYWSTVVSSTCEDRKSFLLRTILQLDSGDLITIDTDVSKLALFFYSSKLKDFGHFIGMKLEEDLFP
ncbi:Uncharacterized protein APZ42_017143 [Daphnia magna]|uniref:C1q domain-containing protein n=1 Tax=Daphnia magna TaxID=35525 RepID=A0A164ZPY2_9CRUS|nr:Uncharacterized protein APZ42_017143 [Daphnia magna]